MRPVKHCVSCLLMSTILLISMLSVSFSATSISVRNKYYNISGATAAQLKAQMRERGPEGYWAYARWYVRWTGSCELSVTLTYTYPRWTDKNKASRSLRKNWERMMKNLRRHEKGHGQHGINAAREIEESQCRGNPKEITRKWARQDKIYDRRTNHGRNQGVHF